MKMDLGEPLTNPIRFGLQLRGANIEAIRAQSLAAEAAGFSSVLVADHLDTGLDPLVVLADLAIHTSTIRLGTLVLNNDLRHPVMLARQIVALDHISGGRIELGLGAGHTPREYAAIGLALDPPRVRKARLYESISLLRRLLAGEEVNHVGDHCHLTGASIRASTQATIPMLIGGSGPTLLDFGARSCEIINLTGLGRTLPDGHKHEVRWNPELLDADVAQIAAIRVEVGRTRPPELSALVQVVDVTDDRHTSATELVSSVAGLTVADALITPFLAIGTHQEIADHFRAAHQRWGINYFCVRSLDAIASVIELLT